MEDVVCCDGTITTYVFVGRGTVKCLLGEVDCNVDGVYPCPDAVGLKAVAHFVELIVADGFVLQSFHLGKDGSLGLG